MKLVIVESPAKCKKIASFLGPGYKVLATMGHIRTLEQDLSAIGLDTDFSLRFTFMKEKAQTMNAIKDAAKGASTIFLCADDDREGEAIAYSVACLLKRDPASFPRSVFHEITQKAVTHAIANPRKIDMNKVYAQQARSVLDMMIGFTISPLLWKFVARGLSAGRCQTPALRLVHERELAIESHVSTSAWGLTLGLGKIEGKLEDDLCDEESVMNYLENIHCLPEATVWSVKDSKWSAAPPKPLITSTLQQEVSAAYGFNPKTTMQIAQKLYEAGHITYMRTDNAVISQEAVKEAHAWIEETYGKSYVGTAVAVAPEKGLAQEAHEAIRPTHMECKEIEGAADERKLYAFIWKRSMQSTMAPATGVKRIVRYRLDGDPDEFSWMSSQLNVLFQGWQILGKQVAIDSEEEEDDQGLDAMKEGQKIRWTTITTAPKHSTPSPRFTQATLVRELEHCGIGRPSTFASLIDVLLTKEYIEVYDNPGSLQTVVIHTLSSGKWPPVTAKVERRTGVDKKKVRPTKLGRSVLDLCLKEFSALFDYSFTSTMEQRLDLVAAGNDSWKTVCSDIWTSYKDTYLRLKDSHSMPTKSEKACELGEGYKAVLSKNGPLLLVNKVFTPLPEGTVIQDMTLEDAKRFLEEHQAEHRLGTYDGAAILKKKGPYGEYIQWKDKKVPLIAGETIDKTVERLEAKGSVQKVGESEKVCELGEGYKAVLSKNGPLLLVNTVFTPLPEGTVIQDMTLEDAKRFLEEHQAEHRLGTYDGAAILKKKGPYGEYIHWKDKKVPLIAGETIDKTVERLEAKGSVQKVGEFAFSRGQYGPYMYKADLKKKVFISIPEGIDLARLSPQGAKDLYTKGCAAKKMKGRRSS